MFRRRNRICIGSTESSNSLLAKSDESGECIGIPSKGTGNTDIAVCSNRTDGENNNSETVTVIELNDVKQGSESKAINWLLDLDQCFDDEENNSATATSDFVNTQALDNFSLLRRTSNRCLLQWKPDRSNDSTPPGFNSKTYIFRNIFPKHTAASAADVEESADQRHDHSTADNDNNACENMMGRKRKLCPFSFRRALKSAWFAASIPLPPHNRREWPYLKFRREHEPPVDKTILISSDSSISSSSSETLFSRYQNQNSANLIH